MAVALRDFEQPRPRPRLRVVPAPPLGPRRRVFWMRRALVLALLVGALLAVVGGARAIGPGPDDEAQITRTDLTVVVAPGETLWQIATRYAPQDRDLVEWSNEIARRNNVDPRALQPGTPLVIPLETLSVAADPAAVGKSGR